MVDSEWRPVNDVAALSGNARGNWRLKAAVGYGILWAMKDFAYTNTHYEGRSHVRFLAASAFALAASALFAEPSQLCVCYKPDEGTSIYPWGHAAKWFDTTGSCPSRNRVPTTTDYVVLYSSKNGGGAFDFGNLDRLDGRNGIRELQIEHLVVNNFRRLLPNLHLSGAVISSAASYRKTGRKGDGCQTDLLL